MTEILYQSDFELHVNFIDHFNQAIDVKSFSFKYTTQYCTEPVIATFDGVNYSGCEKVEGGVLIKFKNPQFTPECQLIVHRDIQLSSNDHQDEVLNVKQVDKLPYTIVKSYSTIAPEVSKTVVIPSDNRLMHFEETIKVAALLGRQIVTEEPEEIDYSSIYESMLVNKLYVNNAGVKSQLYGRRIQIELQINNSEIYMQPQTLSMLRSITGTLLMPNDRSFAIGQSVDIPTNCYVQNGELIIHIHSLPPHWNGSLAKIDLYIEYTK